LDAQHVQVYTGGIGEVCTRPDKRRAGLAPQVLTDAIETMRATGFQISLLHTSRLQSFYAKLGWFSVAMTFYQSVVDIQRLVTLVSTFRDAGEDMVRLPTHTPDWAMCEGLRQQAARRRNWRGYSQRSEAYWSKWLAEECQQFNCSLTWLSDGTVFKAYMATKVAHSRVESVALFY